jgi:hypothetical protein
MQTRTVFSALTLIGALVLPCTSLGQSRESLFETRKLNPAKSKYSPDPPHRSNTLKYEPWECGLKFTTDAVTAQGEARHTEVTGKFDGKDNPVKGNPEADTNAYRRIDDHTDGVVAKKGGKVTTTSRIVVWPDGKSRTTTQTEQVL